MESTRESVYYKIYDYNIKKNDKKKAFIKDQKVLFVFDPKKSIEFYTGEVKKQYPNLKDFNILFCRKKNSLLGKNQTEDDREKSFYYKYNLCFFNTINVFIGESRHNKDLKGYVFLSTNSFLKLIK